MDDKRSPEEQYNDNRAVAGLVWTVGIAFVLFVVLWNAFGS